MYSDKFLSQRNATLSATKAPQKAADVDPAIGDPNVISQILTELFLANLRIIVHAFPWLSLLSKKYSISHQLFPFVD